MGHDGGHKDSQRARASSRHDVHAAQSSYTEQDIATASALCHAQHASTSPHRYQLDVNTTPTRQPR